MAKSGKRVPASPVCKTLSQLFVSGIGVRNFRYFAVVVCYHSAWRQMWHRIFEYLFLPSWSGIIAMVNNIMVTIKWWPSWMYIIITPILLTSCKSGKFVHDSDNQYSHWSSQQGKAQEYNRGIPSQTTHPFKLFRSILSYRTPCWDSGIYTFFGGARGGGREYPQPSWPSKHWTTEVARRTTPGLVESKSASFQFSGGFLNGEPPKKWLAYLSYLLPQKGLAYYYKWSYNL